jgi:hypothetical protein
MMSIENFFLKKLKYFKQEFYSIDEFQSKIINKYSKLDKKKIDFRIKIHPIHGDSLLINETLMDFMVKDIVVIQNDVIRVNIPFY